MTRPRTLRVRVRDGTDGPYLDRWSERGAAHYWMDEDRFQQALDEIYDDRPTPTPPRPAHLARVVRSQTRRARVISWLDERCARAPWLEAALTTLLADCSQWHEERGFDPPSRTLLARVLTAQGCGAYRRVVYAAGKKQGQPTYRTGICLAESCESNDW